MHKRRYSIGYRGCAACAAALLILALSGCGSTEPAADEWDAVSAEVQQARVQRQLDSLIAENRHLREQVSVLAAENRNLSSRNAQLEAAMDALPAQDAAATSADATPAPSPIPAAYNEGVAFYQQKKYKEAIGRMEDVLSTRLDPSLADNCHYWIGESHYALKNYEEAVKHFEAALQYKNADKAAEARFMLGTTYAAMGDGDTARLEFGKFIRTYPNSPLVKKARERMAKLK